MTKTGGRTRKRRDFVKVGNVRIGWAKYKDGRTCLDLRPWRKENTRPTFVDHAEALREAQRLAAELNAGGTSSQDLTSAERAVFAHARKAAAEFSVDVSTVVHEWQETRRLLATVPEAVRPTIAQAVAAGMEALRRPVHKTIDVVFRFLFSKGAVNEHGKLPDAHKLDGRHLRDLRQYLLSFAAACPDDFACITPPQIEQWRDGLRKKNGDKLSDCRLNHAHDAVIALFNYARAQEILPDKITSAAKVEKLHIPVKGAVSTWTPDEMQAILDTVEQAWAPYFLIPSFSGARVEEVSKSYHAAARKDVLRWEDFVWDEHEIVIRAEVAKTGKHRRIPLFDVLFDHLTFWRDSKAKGPVVTGSADRFRARFKKQLAKARIAEAANLAGVGPEEFPRLPASEQAQHLQRCVISAALVDDWQNQLRHSYGTYRMAQCGRNKFTVATEMGNSPGIVEKHYDNRVARNLGDVWFSLYPQRPSNVVQLHLALVKPEAPKPRVTKRDNPARLRSVSVANGPLALHAPTE